jgi:hypothetical protein
MSPTQMKMKGKDCRCVVFGIKLLRYFSKPVYDGFLGTFLSIFDSEPIIWAH